MNSSTNISEYISNIQNPEKKQYFSEIIDLLKKPGRKVAYHAFCTDGAISAALLKLVGEGDIFVPLDYSIINNKILGPWLSVQEWYAIVDLKPINTTFTAELYVDHHISGLGAKFNAKRIHFETGKTGPSGAFVLWKYMINKFKFPRYVKVLIEMSVITDTASYKTPAPITLFEKENYEFSDDQLDSKRFHKAIWDLQDALTFENKTVNPNNLCVDLLAKGGLEILLENEIIIKRINKHRSDRMLTLEFAKTLTATELTTIINPKTRNVQDFLVHYLTNNGAKVVVILKEDPFDKTCSISLRQSKLNQKSEKDKYRLDTFAKLFTGGGGGHIEAAGSHSNSLKEAIEIIETWSKEKELKSISYNVEKALNYN
ncbi:MAG: hypothetical protein HeimC3_42170 [Candidatus Heimdallarchaeota archaeon LC_3]|nr:MAG: hypothetical protein HeimC3_42170 [Candidatus Heimdallarchaeota archaeon LC_3]